MKTILPLFLTALLILALPACDDSDDTTVNTMDNVCGVIAGPQDVSAKTSVTYTVTVLGDVTGLTIEYVDDSGTHTVTTFEGMVWTETVTTSSQAYVSATGTLTDGSIEARMTSAAFGDDPITDYCSKP